MRATTKVAIIGAGPAGLLLGHLLRAEGIDCLILERQTRAHVESRIRAGVLETVTTDLLHRLGIDAGLNAHGLKEEGFNLADGDRKVSQLYDMIHPNASETVTVRSLFVIDPKKKVRLTITYPASTGRNFDEILRVIDSLQLTDNYSVATPGNWKDGEDVVIVPSIKDEAVLKEKFPKGYKVVRPYLRLTPQPNK